MEEIFAVKYSFHPESQAEFYQSIEYYDEREDGLGYDFAVEVFAAIERAAANPEIWPLAHSDIRRCLVHRFPYGILYHYPENGEEILIVAVMHLHRDPEYWKTRC
jgi:toxin ParE1/3/4